jgi:DNA repair photolyase
MIRDIQAKSILNTFREPDPIFRQKYNMNLYRGCQHQCIYCDSRSACYQIEDFNHEVLVKSNAIELLEKELARKRVKGAIGTGSMNDPYMPLEAERQMTRQALEVIARYHFPVHVQTKSDLVLKDIDILREINRVYAVVSFTVTCADDELSRKVEPGAPVSSRRMEAMRRLREEGIHSGIMLMPVLPFIEDTEENITRIVEQAYENRAEYIVAFFGMSLRDRQRAYFYQKLDLLFPGLRKIYEQTYGDHYSCMVPGADGLNKLFEDLCRRYKIPTRIPTILDQDRESKQLSLF